MSISVVAYTSPSWPWHPVYAVGNTSLLEVWVATTISSPVGTGVQYLFRESVNFSTE